MNKKFVQEYIYDGGKQRLDIYSAQVFDLTRSQAQKHINEGTILVNGEQKKTKYELISGDKVTMSLNQPQSQKIEIPILYEDEDILVIDKPAGISVHPADGEKGITVVELLSDKLSFKGASNREGIVHRLDKGTSGVMVVAKNLDAQTVLQRDFKDRKVAKTYIALIEGSLEPKAGVIEIPITRDLLHRNKMTVSKLGKEAITQYSTIEVFDKYTLLKLNPKTGRTHQLRVHMSALGNPIVGDLRYGKKSELTGRIFLHAAKIEFKHPRTNKKITIESPLPRELEKLLKSLG